MRVRDVHRPLAPQRGFVCPWTGRVSRSARGARHGVARAAAAPAGRPPRPPTGVRTTIWTPGASISVLTPRRDDPSKDAWPVRQNCGSSVTDAVLPVGSLSRAGDTLGFPPRKAVETTDSKRRRRLGSSTKTEGRQGACERLSSFIFVARGSSSAKELVCVCRLASSGLWCCASRVDDGSQAPAVIQRARLSMEG